MLYELMLITKSGGTDNTVSDVEKIIKAQSATVKFSKLGKKTLAYPISGQTEAEYTVFNFEAEGAAISEISGKLRLEQEAILRYLIIKSTGKGNAKLEVSAEEKKIPKVTVKTVGAKTSDEETKKAKPKSTKKETIKKGKKK